MEIKQKGRNNQFQFAQLLTANYANYLSTSDSYMLANLIYERTKELAKLNYGTQTGPFSLLKYIKLYVIWVRDYITVSVSDLLNNSGAYSFKHPLTILKQYLEYYGLVCFVGDDECDIEKLNPLQKIDICDISFFE